MPPLSMSLSKKHCRTLCAIFEEPTRANIRWADFLALCRALGADVPKPEKTWVGKLTIRVDEDLRRRLTVVAAASGASINAWITALLDRETKRVLQEHEVAG